MPKRVLKVEYSRIPVSDHPNAMQRLSGRLRVAYVHLELNHKKRPLREEVRAHLLYGR